MRTKDGIPVIDLAGVQPAVGHVFETVASEFCEAFHTVGFAYLINHGIDQDVINQCMSSHADFHAQPITEKRKIALNAWHRGFLEMSSYQLKSTHKTRGVAVADAEKEIQYPNQSESFIINHEHLEDPFVCDTVFICNNLPFA